MICILIGSDRIIGNGVMDDMNKTQDNFLVTQEDFQVDDLQKLLRRVNQCEKRYKRLVENYPHGFQVIDIYGKIIYVNSKLCNRLGYVAGELEGKDIWALLGSEAERTELTEFLTRIARNASPSRSWAGNYVRKDRKREQIPLEWDGMRDEHGRVIGFISFTAAGV